MLFASRNARRSRHLRSFRLANSAAVIAASIVCAALLGTSRAWAACSPATGIGTPSNTTITCSGTMLNQDNPNGYGTGQPDNNAVNLQAGASVTGSTAGLDLDASNTVDFAADSAGTISGTSAVRVGTNTPLGLASRSAAL